MPIDSLHQRSRIAWLGRGHSRHRWNLAEGRCGRGEYQSNQDRLHAPTCPNL